MRDRLEREILGEHGSIKKHSWKNINTWFRGFAMLCFGFIAGFARLAITLISVFQFITLLLTEKPNKTLLSFGQAVNNYIYQINQFLTMNSEKYPFPLSSWPDDTTSVRNYSDSI